MGGAVVIGDLRLALHALRLIIEAHVDLVIDLLLPIRRPWEPTGEARFIRCRPQLLKLTEGVLCAQVFSMKRRVR